MILLDGIMKEQENTKESKEIKHNSFLGSVVSRFLQKFKPKCTNCGSRDNKIDCYYGNPYDRNEKTKTGRQCNNCVNFWYS